MERFIALLVSSLHWQNYTVLVKTT